MTDAPHGQLVPDHISEIVSFPSYPNVFPDPDNCTVSVMSLLLCSHSQYRPVVSFKAPKVNLLATSINLIFQRSGVEMATLQRPTTTTTFRPGSATATTTEEQQWERKEEGLEPGTTSWEETETVSECM